MKIFVYSRESEEREAGAGTRAGQGQR